MAILSTLKLTDGGDLVMNTLNQAVTLTGRDAIEQKVKAAFSLWLGNWFRDLNRGVDWLKVFKKKYTQREVITVLTKAILQLDVIDSVIDIYLKVDKVFRTAEITYLVLANGEKVLGTIPL